MTSPTRWKGTRAHPVNGVSGGGKTMDTKRGGVDYTEAHLGLVGRRGAQEDNKQRPSETRMKLLAR